ncbi:MAG: aldo/keto reductase [Desulfobacteraceae bacterium]
MISYIVNLLKQKEHSVEMRSLGNSGIKISPILMGTWQAGKTMWTGIDDTETQKAIRAAYDAGINAFDTAEVYGNGHSERILGKALVDVRDKVVIMTKVFSNHLKYNQVIKACERSLKNLQTEYIDLYQVHWPPGSFGHVAVPMQEIMEAFGELVKQGKIRAIGVSNFNRQQLEAAAQFATVVSLQSPYSLFWRHVEEDAAGFCRENGLSLLAYSPMAQGLLTGKFGPNHRFEKGDHRSSNRLFHPPLSQHVQAALSQLKPIAAAKGISLGQLALAWVISHPDTFAIAGARNPQQAIQNAAAARMRLSAEEMQALDQISASVTAHLDDNPVLWKW